MHNGMERSGKEKSHERGIHLTQPKGVGEASLIPRPQDRAAFLNTTSDPNLQTVPQTPGRRQGGVDLGNPGIPAPAVFCNLSNETSL